jgi:hypothetical protein
VLEGVKGTRTSRTRLGSDIPVELYIDSESRFANNHTKQSSPSTSYANGKQNRETRGMEELRIIWLIRIDPLSNNN